MGEQDNTAEATPRTESLQDFAARYYRINLTAERAAAIAREVMSFNLATATPVAPAIEPGAPFRGLLIGGAPRP